MNALNQVVFFLDSPTQYQTYSLWHLAALLCAVLLGIGIFFLARTTAYDRMIRLTLCLVTVTCLIGSCFSYHFIPLHVCHVSAWFVLPMALLFRVKVFQYFLLYISGWGALIALIIPDLQSHTTWYRFIIFFTMHACLVIGALYCFFKDRPESKWVSILYTFLVYNLYIIIVGIVDYIIDANYVFLSHPPESLQAYFTWPWYIFEFQLFFIALSFMTCALSRYYQYRMNRYNSLPH
ncbi:MAG TPA: TIGR02206 family membrane protein [Coxiellaceae bacterium]|nr:TIGR02206 family membrane protein [Coxiellaceae bacterium]